MGSRSVRPSDLPKHPSAVLSSLLRGTQAHTGYQNPTLPAIPRAGKSAAAAEDQESLTGRAGVHTGVLHSHLEKGHVPARDSRAAWCLTSSVNLSCGGFG